MVTAVVLIKARRGRVQAAAEALADLPGIAEVYSVGGAYDLVAMIRVASNEDLAALVTGPLSSVDGLERTETLLAFKTYSRHDLERMFSIGD